jgi:hypothetical protein
MLLIDEVIYPFDVDKKTDKSFQIDSIGLNEIIKAFLGGCYVKKEFKDVIKQTVFLIGSLIFLIVIFYLKSVFSGSEFGFSSVFPMYYQLFILFFVLTFLHSFEGFKISDFFIGSLFPVSYRLHN